METYHGFPPLPLAEPAFLTVGNFDGVHRGHQRLVSDLVRAAHATGAQAGLLTFDPHPLTVLRPDRPLPQLTSPAERAAVLAALGLDFLLILTFSRETARLPAAGFMEQLTSYVRLQELWIGPDFALGRDREGDAGVLAELGSRLGYTVQVAPPVHWRGEPVRSSRVRHLLTADGDVAQASELLGRAYQVWGQVVQGAGRGRRLGFPTANLATPPERLLPARGVYACWAWLEDSGWPAVVNVGVRPSFDNGKTTVEAYLPAFDGDLYGRTLGLSFVKRLRGEQRFAHVEELREQIYRDTAAARRVLGNPQDHAAAAGKRCWQENPHTADIAIGIRAGSQAELFACAAQAMFALQDADRSRAAELAQAVTTTAQDAAELMVAWLSRLLLAQELAGALFNRFEIQEISSRGLRAVAYGYRGAAGHTVVKAVTYYDLAVREVQDGWEARITFDV